MMRQSLLIATVFVSCLLLSGNAPGAEYHIHTVDEFQTALTSAASNPEDDTIIVATGTYTLSSCQLYYSTRDGAGRLTIQAENPRALPLLDGQDSARLMAIYTDLNGDGSGDSGDDIVERGIVFRNGRGDVGLGVGGLYLSTGAANILIDKCLFLSNKGPSDISPGGAQLLTATGSITVQKTSFLDNINSDPSGMGGGLYMGSISGDIELAGCSFFRNTAAFGGGVFLQTDGRVTMRGNTFTDNTANAPSGTEPTGGGAWIYAPQATIHVSGNKFLGNKAISDPEDTFGGGLRCDGSEIVFENNYFADNIAKLGGGFEILNQYPSQCRITNNTVWHNQATAHDGGGAWIYISPNDSTFTITNNIFRANHGNGNQGDDLRIETNSGTTVNLSYNVLGPHTSFASGHSDDLYITNTGNYYHHDNSTDDPRLKDDGHLPGGSPAINAGICGMQIPDFLHGGSIYYRIAPEDDIDGDGRPGTGVVMGCDIGADEYKFPWPMFLPAIVHQRGNP